VVSSSDVVVLVRLNALFGIFLIEVCFKRRWKLLQNSVFNRNLILTNDKPSVFYVWNLFIPRVISYLLNGQSLFSICVQYAFKNIRSVFTDKFWNFVICTENFLIQLACVRIFKREKPTYHCKQNDPCRPNVNSGSIVPFTFNHFWGGIARRTARCF